jgi:hypothetical protein
MASLRLLVSHSSRQTLHQLAPARIFAGPDCRIPRPVASTPTSRYFSSTNTCNKTKAAKEKVEGDVEGLEFRETEAESRRIMDNNNPVPAVSLPGGLAWPFTGSNAVDAAITTLVGLGLGVWNLST